jgi:putative transposase
MLLERGIVISYETVRRWALKFGPAYARRLGRRTPSRRDIWHLDELVISIAGKKHWLWRAVDQDGYVLDKIVQTRRDTKAAKHLLKRRLKKQDSPPRRLITDKPGSYAAARGQIMPAVEPGRPRTRWRRRMLRPQRQPMSEEFGAPFSPGWCFVVQYTR